MITEKEKHNFFIIIPLGLEELAQTELLEKFPSLDNEEIKLQVIKGGIDLWLSLEDGLILNHYLKIPSRILLKLESFTCRDFPKLFKKVSKFSWNKFFGAAIPEIKSSSSKSRVFDSRKIESTLIAGMEKYRIANTPRKKDLESISEDNKPTLFIRFENDQCTLSLDTTGEHLHKRGKKIYSTAAPLRENFAAAIVYKIRKVLQEHQSLDLIDPMAGSGSITFEASDFYNKSDSRSFAYQSFPFLKRNEIKLNHDFDFFLFNTYFAMENDKDSLSALTKNSKNYQNIKIKNHDIFTKLLSDDFDHPKVIITNPPYGKRIKLEQELEAYFKKLKVACTESFDPLAIGFLLPSTYQKFLDSSFKSVLNFSNGGIKVSLFLSRQFTS